MSPEIIAIVAVGVALAGLMLRGHRSLDKRIDEVSASLDKRIDEVSASLGRDIHEVNNNLGNRIDEVNNNLGNRIDEVNNNLGNRIDILAQRMDGFDRRMDSFDERLRTLETGQAELKGTILGKLDFIERYIIARNLQASGESPEPAGADE